MKKEETQIVWTMSSNDVADHRDLTLRLALRTLLYKSFQDIDLDTILAILRSEADDLQHKMTKAPEMQLEEKPW